MIVSVASVPLSEKERTFFLKLGKRIAAFRKQAGLTQSVVADHLGLSQQTVDGFEKGRRRVQVYSLVRLAQLFDVSIVELTDERYARTKSKPGPDSKIEQRMARLQGLSRSQQRTVLAMIDGLIESSSSNP